MGHSRIALNAISTARIPFDDALSIYSEAGFQNLEFPLPWLKEWLAQGHSVTEAREMLNAKSVHFIGGFETAIIAFGDVEARAKNHALLIENAQLIEALGGSVLVVGSDGPPERKEDALQTLALALREVAAQMPTKVAIALEFNWSPLVKSLRSAFKVIELADRPNIGILFDTAHYFCTPNRLEDLKPEVIQRILHVHWNDMRDTPPDLADCNADRVLPGEGVLNLHAIRDKLEAGGYRGYYSLELFNQALWALPAEESAARCFRAMLPLNASL